MKCENQINLSKKQEIKKKKSPPLGHSSSP